MLRTVRCGARRACSRGAGVIGVPVPKMIASDSNDPLGAPFIVMEWSMRALGNAPTPSFACFTATGAAIHALDAGARSRVPGVPEAWRPAFAPNSMRGGAHPTFGCDDDALWRARWKRCAEYPGERPAGALPWRYQHLQLPFPRRGVVAVVDWERREFGPAQRCWQLVALSHLKGAPFGPAIRSLSSSLRRCAGKSRPAWRTSRPWLFELGVIYTAGSAQQQDPWYTGPPRRPPGAISRRAGLWTGASASRLPLLAPAIR